MRQRHSEDSAACVCASRRHTERRAGLSQPNEMSEVLNTGLRYFDPRSRGTEPTVNLDSGETQLKTTRIVVDLSFPDSTSQGSPRCSAEGEYFTGLCSKQSTRVNVVGVSLFAT